MESGIDRSSSPLSVGAASSLLSVGAASSTIMKHGTVPRTDSYVAPGRSRDLFYQSQWFYLQTKKDVFCLWSNNRLITDTQGDKLQYKHAGGGTDQI